MQQLYGHSITYRIAIGPHQGRKVFTLQSLDFGEKGVYASYKLIGTGMEHAARHSRSFLRDSTSGLHIPRRNTK
jgi:hypothetical protein